MRKDTSLLATIVVGAIVGLMACQTPNVARQRNSSNEAGVAKNVNGSDASPSPIATTTDATTHGDGVRRITVAEASAALEKGEAVIVDVRDAQSYAAGHIKGSLSIPGDDIAARVRELPRDKLIVTYCA